MWVFPEVRTVGQYVEYWARHQPDRPALRTLDRVMTSAELDRSASQFAHFLDRTSARAGDLVGYLGRNSCDFYIALFGTAKTRCGLTPWNWRLSPNELAAQIADSAAPIAVVERDCEGLWRQVCSLLSQAPEVIWIDAQSTLEAQVDGHDVVRTGEPAQLDDTFLQIYTSGTTGAPKGVMLTHGGADNSRLCEHLEPAYAWRMGDSFVNGLPNFHLLHLGIALQCLYNGVAIDIVRQFDPTEMLATISRLRPTLLTLTPTMLQLLLDHPDAAGADFSSIRLTVYAGAPISLGLIKRAMAVMPGEFMQFYGATETGGATCLLRPSEHDLGDEARLQSCGRPLPLVACRILDSTGEEVPPGEVGELVIRQPSIMKGYWRQAELTAEVFQNGWFRTGDLARRDADGLYYLVGRIKDLIVSGGENIYAIEVENVLSTHPAIADVAVIGVPDKLWGECVKAVVVQRSDTHHTDAAELLAFCRTRLAAYKVPKTIDFVSALPLVPSGKVSKKDLRAPYWANYAREVA